MVDMEADERPDEEEAAQNDANEEEDGSLEATFQSIRAMAFKPKDCVKCTVLVDLGMAPAGRPVRVHSMTVPGEVLLAGNPPERSGTLEELGRCLREEVGASLRGLDLQADAGILQGRIFQALEVGTGQKMGLEGISDPQVHKAIAEFLLPHLLEAGRTGLEMLLAGEEELPADDTRRGSTWTLGSRATVESRATTSAPKLLLQESGRRFRKGSMGSLPEGDPDMKENEGRIAEKENLQPIAEKASAESLVSEEGVTIVAPDEKRRLPPRPTRWNATDATGQRSRSYFES